MPDQPFLDTLTPGTRVRHAQYGFGYIRVHTKTTLSVQFDTHGTREFLRGMLRPDTLTIAPPLR